MSKIGFNRKKRSVMRGKRALMNRLAKESLRHFQISNFNAEGFIEKPNGRPKKWKKLASPRRKNTKMKGTTRPILQDTGRLRRSGVTRVFSRSYAQVLFKADYASYHNRGNKETNLDQRRFSGKSRALDKKCDRIILNYVKTRLG